MGHMTEVETYKARKAHWFDPPQFKYEPPTNHTWVSTVLIRKRIKYKPSRPPRRWK